MAFWLCSSSWRESFWEKVRKLFQDVRRFSQLEMLTTGKLDEKVTNIFTNKVTIKMFVRSLSWKCLRQVNPMKKVTNKVNCKVTN
jgi:hypothetical protein